MLTVKTSLERPLTMLTLSKFEAISKIREKQAFEAIIEDCGLILNIEQYAPYICTAIHHGHNLRASLIKQCLLSESERLYEEDPFTGEFISSMPITMLALNSRYEYDLNRTPEDCIYSRAWGKQVWSSHLNTKEITSSLTKHQNFYDLLYQLVQVIESKYQACVIYDIHSYNYLRINRATPCFNIGTAQIDEKRWKNEVTHFLKKLNHIELPNIEVLAEKNTVFQGMGYLATYVKNNFKNTLVLPTEIKKIYMDENTGEAFPIVVNELKIALKDAISLNAAYFSRRNTIRKSIKRLDLLSSKLDPAIKRLDNKLYNLTKDVETLVYINPVNPVQEQKRFFAKKYQITPNFRYRQLNIDPYQFKESLYRLPVDDIKDIGIQNLYRAVINSYAEKIDLLTSIGTEQFFYNSLRYYGEPNNQDIENAKFILYARHDESDSDELLDGDYARQSFLKAIEDYGFKCRVELTGKIIAGAMVNNSRKTILINKRKYWTPTELEGLIHHELGVHMVTTINSTIQPLKIFKLGLPGNTQTQEGLAILSEYLSNSLTLTRLKTLALRVLTVHMMVNNYTFSKTFEALIDEYHIDPLRAFTIVSRAYRGGGFTKDYLYLSGLKDTLDYIDNRDYMALFIGKTSFSYLEIINELIQRNILESPRYLPQSVSMIPNKNTAISFVINSLR